MLSTDRKKWLENRPRSIVGVEMERVNHQQKSGQGLRHFEIKLCTSAFFQKTLKLKKERHMLSTDRRK